MSNFQELVTLMKRAVLIACGALLLGTLVTPPPADAAVDRLQPYTSGKAFVVIGGQFAGWVDSVSGGYTRAQIQEFFDDQSGRLIKRIVGVAPEDLEITFDMQMAPLWWQWISESIGAKPGLARDMAVFRTNQDHQTIDRLVLYQARIKRLELPTFDATGQAPISFKVVISAAASQWQSARGESAPPYDKARRLLSRNFRFELGDFPATGVSKVVPPAINIDFGTEGVGQTATKATSTPRMSVGNMTVIRAVIVDHLRAHMDWLQQLTEGRSGPSDRLQSRLIVLEPETGREVMTFYFDNVGLVSIDPFQDLPGGSLNGMAIELLLDSVRLGIRR